MNRKPMFWLLLPVGKSAAGEDVARVLAAPSSDRFKHAGNHVTGRSHA